jgi:hypothetical protein
MRRIQTIELTKSLKPVAGRMRLLPEKHVSAFCDVTKSAYDVRFDYLVTLQ